MIEIALSIGSKITVPFEQPYASGPAARRWLANQVTTGFAEQRFLVVIDGDGRPVMINIAHIVAITSS